MMARPRKQSDIGTLVQEFVVELVSLVERQATQQIQAQVLAALGGGVVRRGPGRPPKALALNGMNGFSSFRRPRPKQLCPVPGCKNVAAPIFGMVCGQHKDMPKAKIKEYREARRKAITAEKSA